MDFAVDGLSPGTYTLAFSGNGYIPYTQEITLNGYSQHLILSMGDVFVLGDVSGDIRVDTADHEAFSEALGSTNDEDISVCDLNGDGKIDIVDLAYE